MAWLDTILAPNVNDNDDFDKVRKLRLLNILVLSDLVASIVYTFIGLFSGHFMYMKLNIGSTIFFAIVYIFIYYRRIYTAVILMIIIGDGLAFFYIYYFADIGIEYYLISAVIVLSFVFGDKPLILGGIFSILGAMLILIQFFDKYFQYTISSYNHEVAEWVKYPNIIFSVVLIYISMRQYHIDLGKSFKTINNQNKDLAEKNDLIYRQKTMVENSDRTKNKILSIIAHDLRGPINNLKGTLYLLAGKGLNETDRDRLLKTLHDSTSQTANFLELLLIWGKNQFKGARIDMVEFDLGKLADEIADLAAAQANLKSIAISCHYSGQVLIKSDRDLIHISVRNLVNNAIKFTPEHGKITISVYPKDTMVDIVISDTGRGIDQQNLSELFSMEIESKAGTKNEKGTGIGLILVKECIEKCQGTIHVASELGIGTTFTVSLPWQLDLNSKT